jgi:hypothetical protein
MSTGDCLARVPSRLCPAVTARGNLFNPLTKSPKKAPRSGFSPLTLRVSGAVPSFKVLVWINRHILGLARRIGALMPAATLSPCKNVQTNQMEMDDLHFSIS